MAPLEKYMIEQGAPTLASLKTGTLFCVDTTEPGELLVKELAALSKQSPAALAAGRYKKFRMMGAGALRKERL